MKLIEALGIIAKKPEGDPVTVRLVCGFTPLHMQTFLQAELQLLFPDRPIEITTGLYGDIAGTLREAKDKNLEAVALVLEWEDLDGRLGTRQLGGWHVRNVENILVASQLKLSMLEQLLTDLSKAVPVVVSLPTLPLPPVFVTTGWQASSAEIILSAQLSAFSYSLAQQSRIRVVNEQRLHALSPFAARLSIKSDWTAGFPYSVPHAAALAGVIARLIRNPLPKKGIITDLDNTLWSGIVGEVGVEEIHWDLDHHSQAHGLYQQFLQLLSEEGVLVAAASKNDPAVVEQAFQRADLLLSEKSVFPFEVSWGSKSKAVSRILAAWNIGPESVVFVDDSPLELAEVQTQHPEIECLEFRADDSVYELISHLRDLFGKSSVSQEDRLRLESIRSSASLQRAVEDDQGFSEALLEQADAELLFSLRKDAGDSRAFELINKTNQFNLNGKRFTEAAWQTYLSPDDRFLLTASYSDRFGSLGKIAVIAGRQNGMVLSIDSWVMSCRAFARRIEHQCLSFMFTKFNSAAIIFDYQPTPRNGPVKSFFENLIKQTPTEKLEISRDSFAEVCPKLFHRVREVNNE
jgi:FkbH-like protein